MFAIVWLYSTIYCFRILFFQMKYVQKKIKHQKISIKNTWKQIIIEKHLQQFLTWENSSNDLCYSNANVVQLFYSPLYHFKQKDDWFLHKWEVRTCSTLSQIILANVCPKARELYVESHSSTYFSQSFEIARHFIIPKCENHPYLPFNMMCRISDCSEELFRKILQLKK